MRHSSAPLALDHEMARLHHQLDGVVPQRPGRMLQFISARRGEGTSTIAGEFARVAGGAFDERTLLLTVGEVPAGAASPEAPRQVADSLYHAAVPLNGLPGLRKAAPGGDPFWQRLRQGFDLVVLDASPAQSPEVVALSRHVDGVVLVVEAENTRWPIAAHLKEDIIRSGGHVVGLVLNKRRYYLPTAIYNRL